MSYTATKGDFQQSQGERSNDGLTPTFGAFDTSKNPVALFFRCCINAGKRRDRDGRGCWTREEWEAWCQRGRTAFGNSPRALFGQLALVETMLEHGLDGKQIAAELTRIEANRAAQQKRDAESTVELQRRSERRQYEAMVETETRKELAKMEARKRAAEIADREGIADPKSARRRLVSLEGRG
jgi:hypothetical protein